MQVQMWSLHRKSSKGEINLRPQKDTKRVDTNIASTKSCWRFNHHWEFLLKGLEFGNPELFITDVSGKHPRLWIGVGNRSGFCFSYPGFRVPELLDPKNPIRCPLLAMNTKRSGSQQYLQMVQFRSTRLDMHHHTKFLGNLGTTRLGG
ncbi:hypothetical protein ACS0TY_021442 [Phlomoides rotata]